MTGKAQKEILATKILDFHQKNYVNLPPHQPISDIKASYHQFSRYYGILAEIEKLPFKTFLDAGCAEGMFLLGVKKMVPNAEVYGVDFSAVGVRKAKFYSGRVASLACADLGHLPFGDNSFDLVLCSETLEHIVDDVSALKDLIRICKKTCIVTVPSFSNSWSKKQFKPDVNCQRDSHLRKYSREDLETLLRPHFREVTIFHSSMWYPSSFDIIMHMFIKGKIAAHIGHLMSHFADLDYRMSKAGAHGHSFICICKK